MLASLIAGFASGETILAWKRAKQMAVAYLLAALAGLCGIGFLVGAAYIATADRYGSFQAAVGFGVGFVLLAALIYIVHSVRSRARARLAAQRRSADMKTLGAATAVAALPSLMKSRTGVSVLLAPVMALGAYALYRRFSRTDPDQT